MYILAIDQGTTGTTSLLIDQETLSVVDKYNQEYKQIYPKPGWVEHNLNDIWDSVRDTVTKVLKQNNIQPTQISAIGITNQRETTCAFKKDGTPLANAIVWQDRRTQDFCADLRSNGHEKVFKNKAGLPIDSYFSGTKMNWLLENDRNVKDANISNNLLFGTIDTYLLYKLTSCKSHKTDASNASRTLLMNLDTCQWDSELLEILNVNKDLLPEICDSFSSFGETNGLDFLPDGIPITGILGDQQAALFGQACFSEGSSKCTYGTGAFMLLNTGEKKEYSKNGLLTTVAYKANDKTFYALEGSTYIAGACIQWLRDNLKFFNNSKEVETEANKVSDLSSIEDIFFFPFFTGIGSPYWKSEVKASITGLTRGSGIPEISRAAMEGVSFSINDLITAFEKDFSRKISSLKVDGGAAANNLWMQMQSDISNLTIIRPSVIETTALGAAMAAALGANLKTFDDLKNLWKEDHSFISNSSTKDYYEKKYKKWTNHLESM